MAEEKKLNIYQKLVEVRKGIEKFDKDTTGYNFKYVSGTQVLKAIKANLDKQGIILEQHLTNPIIEDGLVKSPMKMVWVNADNPKDERIVIDWFMVGKQKDPSQSLGSGLTYAERYFLMKFFNIPTDEDDPDSKKPPAGKPTPPATSDKSKKLVTEKQLKRYYAMVKQAGLGINDMDDIVKRKYKIEHKDQLNMTQLDEIFKYLEDQIEEKKVADDFDKKHPEGEQ